MFLQKYWSDGENLWKLHFCEETRRLSSFTKSKIVPHKVWAEDLKYSCFGEVLLSTNLHLTWPSLHNIKNGVNIVLPLPYLLKHSCGRNSEGLYPMCSCFCFALSMALISLISVQITWQSKNLMHHHVLKHVLERNFIYIYIYKTGRPGPTTGCPGPWPVQFWMSPGCRLHNLCQCLTILTVKNIFLYLNRISYISVYAYCLLSFHWTFLRRLWFNLLCTLPSRYLYTLIRSPPSLFFSRLNCPSKSLLKSR